MDAQFKNRLIELADRSYNSGIFTFTDFLGVAEISDLLLMERELNYAGLKMYGGYEAADRQVARFGQADNLGYDIEFPIVCVHVMPLLKKFADELTHRDFLGALMNLGIERSCIGDIKVTEKEAYIFCLENIAPFVSENLTKVKHTNMKSEIITDLSTLNEITSDENLTEKQIVISSMRIDGIISKVYNLSRNESLALFQSQKVFLNGRLTENNSGQVKQGDVINARGYGKFKLTSEPKETKKGKINLGVTIW